MKRVIYTFLVQSSELNEVSGWLQGIEPTGEKWSANGLSVPVANPPGWKLVNAQMVMIFCSDLAAAFKLTWVDSVISSKSIDVQSAKL